jgi:hypothetical protein
VARAPTSCLTGPLSEIGPETCWVPCVPQGICWNAPLNAGYDWLLPVMSVLIWVVTPCGLVGRYRRLGGTYCLHLQGGWRSKAVCLSEKLAATCKSTRHYNPEQHWHHHCRENHIIFFNVCSISWSVVAIYSNKSTVVDKARREWR